MKMLAMAPPLERLRATGRPNVPHALLGLLHEEIDKGRWCREEMIR